ncbi:MAG: MBOAT family protein [Verrucomicrobiales bacterium]|nr:MBOAT family protein [Verrucomicrobiales bacterium]
MVFSSHIFLFGFLPIALLLYYLTPPRGRSITLTLLSYVFYGWWNPWFVLLMLGSTLVDYCCGGIIAKEGQTRRRQKVALWTSITINLLCLGFFKYAIFVAGSIGVVAGWLGLESAAAPDFLSQIILPVGISFYTFQSMSYSIDLYRGDARPARNFPDFACYVSMFPQLVAGPIVRYASIAEQLRSRPHTAGGFAAGLTRFNYGFAKKILLANPMGQIADLCFEAGGGSLAAAAAWIGIIAYALQIYFDFSAYSDMALGLGRMLGFRFLENFDSPYKSTSFTEFWRRWHISLSSFLRDYLYIPLGGNRKGVLRTYVNLLTVMTIGGIWHGASWTFLIWGVLHGVILVVERIARSVSPVSMPRLIGRFLTLFLLLVTWVFFRAESFDIAVNYLKAMFGVAEAAGTSALLNELLFRPLVLGQLITCLAVAFLLPNSSEFLGRFAHWKMALGIGLLVVSVRVMAVQGFNPFLYFQF